MKSTFTVAFRIQVDVHREPHEGDMRQIAEGIAEAALENKAKYASLADLEDIDVGDAAYSGPPRPASARNIRS